MTCWIELQFYVLSLQSSSFQCSSLCRPQFSDLTQSTMWFYFCRLVWCSTDCMRFRFLFLTSYEENFSVMIWSLSVFFSVVSKVLTENSAVCKIDMLSAFSLPIIYVFTRYHLNPHPEIFIYHRGHQISPSENFLSWMRKRWKSDGWGQD